MPQWVRGFVITNVAGVHEAYQKCIRDAERLVALEREARVDRGGRRLLEDLLASYGTFNRNLRLAAQRGAEQAQKGMVERLEATRVRQPTGSTPPLKDLLEAAPLEPIGGRQTGAVGVANVQMLDRAVNPHSRGFGPFWRAVEYGTGQGQVPSQLGRILYGSFTGPGGADPTRPLAEFAGGGGPHPVFIPRGTGVWQQDGERTVGFGTIGKEVPAHHFIRRGADEAAVRWRESVAEVQTRALQELRGIALARS